MELPSAVPAFLEACGKLAGEAASRGHREKALAVLDLALRAARSIT
jgi:hypothetical protein